jgi:Sec-independent protein secretion pathway component TatC
LQNVKHNLKGVLCVILFLSLLNCIRYAVTRDEYDKRSALQLFSLSAVHILALILSHFKLKLLNGVIVVLFIVCISSGYFLQHSIIKSNEEIIEFSASFLSILTYAGFCMLYNIDFIITQYLLTTILVAISATANHFIYGIGSVDYMTTTSFTILIVLVFSIGNYNLNKGMVLQALSSIILEEQKAQQ